MTTLIGLGAAAALLYYWLLCHWFARVLMFLALVVLLGFGGGVMFSAIAVNRLETAPFVVGAILGVIMAWPLASLPTYYHRRQFQRWCAAQRARGMEEYRAP